MTSLNITRNMADLDRLFDDIKLSPPKPNSSRGQTVYINRKDGGKVYICTPQMGCPFGLSNWDGKYSLDLSFNGMDDNNDMGLFYKFVEKLDNLVKSVPQNDSTWFKTVKTADAVKELYRPSCRVDPNGKYAPTLKLKMHIDGDQRMLTQFYNSQKQPIEQDLLVKGSKAMCIIEPSSVWFVNKMFGITWKAYQVKVQPPVSMVSYAFDDDDDIADSVNGLDSELFADKSYQPWENGLEVS